MPRPEQLGKSLSLYLPSEKDLGSWKESASSCGTTLSKYIYEMVERGRQSEQERPRILPRKLDEIQEENHVLQRELRHKNLLLEKLESELFKLRHEAFTKTEIRGLVNFSEDLVKLLQKGGIWNDQDILKGLNIDPKDGDVIKIIARQLEELEKFGLVKRGPKGWQWTE